MLGTYNNYSLPTPISTATTVSSTAFRQLVNQLLLDLTYCSSLCDAILTNRRLGKTHGSFDRLQSGLEASASDIKLQFNHLRKAIGSKMDQGDNKARAALERAVADSQIEIRAKLFDIAYKRHDGRVSPELPGFRELLRRWRDIEREVVDTLQHLGNRFGEKKAEKKHTANISKKYEVKPTIENVIYEESYAAPTEEVTVRLQDLDALLKHMKNSWVEKWVGGDILYINKFDVSKTQWERPSGYIKKLPKSSRRSSETSNPSRDSRESRRSSAGSCEVPQAPHRRETTSDSIWHNPNGW